MSLELVLITLFLNFMSTETTGGMHFIASKLSMFLFKRKMRKFLKKNSVEKKNATIIQTCFFEYVQDNNLLGKIYNYILSIQSSSISNEDYVNGIADEFVIDVKAKGLDVPTEEIEQIHFFLNDILQEFKHHLSKKITDKDKYSSTEICREILENKDKIVSEKDINLIYDYLNQKFNTGSLEEIEKLLVLVKGRNHDIETAIQVKLTILKKDGINFAEIIQKIGDINYVLIKEDVIRSVVVMNLSNIHHLHGLIELINDGQLKQLIILLIDEKWDALYTIEHTKNGEIDEYRIEITKAFVDEDWLKSRIILFSLAKLHIFNFDDIAEKVLESNMNVIDTLNLYNVKINIHYAKNDGKLTKEREEKISLIQSELIANKDTYSKYNVAIRVKYYFTLFQTMVCLDNYDINIEYENMTDELKAIPELKGFKYHYQIKKNQVVEEELIEFCISTGFYWLVNNYCLMKSPEDIIHIIEQYKPMIKKSLDIFLVYVDAICFTKGESDAFEILDEYGSQYGEFLEYCLKKHELTGEPTINDIYSKWDKNEINLLTTNSMIVLFNKLIFNSMFDEAEAMMQYLERIGVTTYDFLSLKAQLLTKTGREIDALDIFRMLYAENKENVFVVEAILVISINNSRKIPVEVLCSAEQFKSPNLLMLASRGYELNEQIGKATILMTKALLLSGDNDGEIMCHYFNFHLRHYEDTHIVISGVDAEVVVYLHGQDIKNKMIICVHAEKILPYVPYSWGGAEHIYLDDAIEMNLFRKKSKDIVIIDDQQYKITEIAPLEAFFVRYSLERMENQGLVKSYNSTEKDGKLLNPEGLLDWIQENMKEESVEISWLNEYKDFSIFPYSFTVMQTFTSITLSQLILCLLEDESIIIRNSINTDKQHADKFVLSYASIILLFKLGVSYELFQHLDVIIPHSTKVKIEEEKKTIFDNANRKVVGRMGKLKGRLFLHEEDENSKLRTIKEATKLNAYINKITINDNNKDISSNKLNSKKIKDVVGIWDYDSMVLAMQEKRALVSMEPLLSAVSGELSINSISVTDFLCRTDISIEKLIECLTQMVNYKVQVFFSKDIIEKLMNEFNKIKSQDDKELVLIEWIEFLSLGEKLDGDYRTIYLQNLVSVLKELYFKYKQAKNPVWTNFACMVIKYISRSQTS